MSAAARYGKKAQSKVKRAMHERKEGTLRSGGSGKKVTSRKQAIAIGLPEAPRGREGPVTERRAPPYARRRNSRQACSRDLDLPVHRVVRRRPD